MSENKDRKVADLSIVIVTLGSEKNLENLRRLLTSLKAHINNVLGLIPQLNLEILIATEQNKEKYSVLCRDIGVSCDVLEVRSFNRCFTANVAIYKAKNNYVAILEDDLVLEEEWIQKMLEYINRADDPKLGCIYSSVNNPLGSESIAIVSQTRSRAILGALVKIVNGLRVHYHIGRKKIRVFSLAVVCRKHSLIEAGLFDPNPTEPIVAEDYDLAIRLQKAGFRIELCPWCIAYHYSRHVQRRALLLLKRPDLYGRIAENEMYFFSKHIDTLGLSLFSHMLWLAVVRPFDTIFRLRSLNLQLSFSILGKAFLYSIGGTIRGFAKGLKAYLWYGRGR